MSGMIAKSQVPTMSRSALPPDLHIALVTFKNSIRTGQNLVAFHNGKPDHRDRRHPGPSPLPTLDNGCCYYEFDVGHGHQNRRCRRLVAEVVIKSLEIREMYFTDDHYTKGSFVRLV